MQCDICHKNEACLHFKEVIQDKVVSLNLCRECADAKGVTKSLAGELELARLIKALSEQGQEAAPPAAARKERRPETTVCPECETTLAEVKKNGRLGCPACYATFAAELEPILAEAHRGLTHTGKTPRVGAPSPQAVEQAQSLATLAQLEEELARAVAAEAYERAAALRDLLSRLQQRLDGVHAAP